MSDEVDEPVIKWTSLCQVKKGEDFFLAAPKHSLGSKEIALFCVFDGHNGTSAAIYSRDVLPELILKHSNGKAGDKEWLDNLPVAMAEAFLECHTEFAKRGEDSGSTATVAIIHGWTLTVAAVGDSRAVLDTVSGGVQEMSVDHRFEVHKEERQRVIQEGGNIARLRTVDGIEVGPLRSWPGGLCVSRSIGDLDCGSQITPLPHVRQIEIPSQGARLIMASDGLWDAVSSDKAARVTRGLNSEKAASSLVKESIRTKGLRDDITVLVVDLLPQGVGGGFSEVPVPKSVTRSNSAFRWCGFPLSAKKDRQLAAVSADVKDDAPSFLNDHDSIKGGTLYQRYLKDGSMHSRGAFCRVCGTQVLGAAGATDTEASVRAGNSFCARHMPR